MIRTNQQNKLDVTEEFVASKYISVLSKYYITMTSLQINITKAQHSAVMLVSLLWIWICKDVCRCEGGSPPYTQSPWTRDNQNKYNHG